MINLNATVVGHSMTLTNASGGAIPTLPTGSINVDAVSFTVSGADWTGTTMHAAFWQDPGAIYKADVSDNVAVIPSEVLTTPGIVYVALYGDNGTSSRISTNACPFSAEQGALTAENAPAPTPSLFEQAVSEATDEAIANALDATLLASRVSMTGYSSLVPRDGQPIADILASDSVLTALQKVRGIMRWDMCPNKQTLDEYASSDDASDVAATDTINSAFSKLQSQANSIKDMLAAEDYTPTWTIGSYINGAAGVSSSTAGMMSNRIILHRGQSIRVDWSEGTATGIGAIAKYNGNSGNSSYTLLKSNEYSADNISFRYTCYDDSITVVLSALKTMTVTVRIFSPCDINIDASQVVGLANALPIPWEYALDDVLCIGDSLTAGVPPNTSTMPNPIRQNYPYYLGRMINASVENAGLSGASVKSWYANKYSNYNMTEYNAVVVFLGTNGNLTDTLADDVEPYDDYNDYADTNTGYYCRLIESIIHDNSNCIIVLVNVWSVSNPASLTDTTRSVIRQIGAKYGLPVVETYDLRYAISPELHGNINNVHMTKAGYLVLANRICSTLRDYLNSNRMTANTGMTAQSR